MTDEQFAALCDAWIRAEKAPDPMSDGVDADAEMRNAGFELSMAGRYRMVAEPADFGAEALRAEGALWLELTSPDVCYCRVGLDLGPKPAYSFALLAGDLRESAPLDRFQDAVAAALDAVSRRDRRAAERAMAAGGLELGDRPGELVADGIPGANSKFSAFPLGDGPR